ncbi:recombinase family protein [Gaetbulibacter aquiaggeris]|uniref:Recombinase family protein n=1 Tax=Gaetbulibacter aquiaggeris TaxID=1735373 RepID=A0ABW7MKX3_9FLAO
MKTILYTRVSTDEQATKGHGRDLQSEVLNKYCEIKNIEIAKEFTEDYSAKNFNRPEWKKLEIYVKANRKDIKQVLFTKWDRFSRNLEESMRVIRKFRNWGVELNAVEQPLDMSIPTNKVMLSLFLIMPEVENDEISRRTKDGLYKATKDGAWVGRVPFGYKRHKFGKYASIEPNKYHKLVYDIFLEVSLGLRPSEVIRRDFKKRGYKGCKQSFYNLLKNKVYLGMTKVPEYKKDDTYWIDGLHDAIIDTVTFNKVQDVLEGRNRNAKPPSKKNEVLPLRGFLECECCGSSLTGSISKGNGGDYAYYHCRKTCKNRISAVSAELMFKNEVLDSINVNDNILELYKEIIIDMQKNKLGNKIKTMNQIKIKIDETSAKIENTEDKLAKDEISSEVFNRITKRYEEDLMSLKAEYEWLKGATGISKNIIEQALKALKNIPQFYHNGNFETKTSLLGLLIPKKLIISKSKCRTKEQNIVIELLGRVSKACGKLDNKKAIISDGLSNMAPPLGLEPRTL